MCTDPRLVYILTRETIALAWGWPWCKGNIPAPTFPVGRCCPSPWNQQVHLSLQGWACIAFPRRHLLFPVSFAEEGLKIVRLVRRQNVHHMQNSQKSEYYLSEFSHKDLLLCVCVKIQLLHNCFLKAVFTEITKQLVKISVLWVICQRFWFDKTAWGPRISIFNQYLRWFR